MPLFNAIAPTFKFTSGDYYTSEGVIATDAQTINNLTVIPFPVDVPVVVDRIGAEMVTPASSGVMRFGIYDSGTGGLPRNLLIESATTSSTAIGTIQATIAQPLPPGVYWLGAVQQTVAGTLRVVSSTLRGTVQSAIPTSAAVGLLQGSVSGTLPATFSGNSISSLACRVWLRAG